MVISMIERSLSNLYRRLGAEASGSTDLMDAETLVAASAGTLKGDRRDEVAARLSRSPLQTDLVRMLRELAPAADSLVGALDARGAYSHVRNARGLRHAARSSSRRQLRWSAIAASMMLVFGALFWTVKVDQLEGTAMTTGGTGTVKPDRIFTSEDRIFAMVDERAMPATTDALFQTDFNGG